MSAATQAVIENVANEELDEVITVEETSEEATIEKGYFYLENRQFHGPFASQEEASEAAIQNCSMSNPGECRAIYHGSAKRDNATNLNEPLNDMHEIASVSCPDTV